MEYDKCCLGCKFWREYSMLSKNCKQSVKTDGICLYALSKHNHTDKCVNFTQVNQEDFIIYYSDKVNSSNIHSINILPNLKLYSLVETKRARYCGFCTYWREDITEDRNRPSVIMGSKNKDFVVLFMGGLSGFCTKSGKACSSDNLEDYCKSFFIGEVTPAKYDTEHFIPLISPRQRLMKSIRIIRSFLYWNMFCIYSMMEEVRCLKTSETALQKELIADMERKIRMPSISFDVNGQLPKLTQFIFSWITDENADYFLNKCNSYNDDIMWDFCERTTLPLDIGYGYAPVYGIRKIKDRLGRLFSIEDLLDMYVEINYDAFAEMYSYTAEKVLPDNNNVKVEFIPDEKYVYCMSVLLKLCSDEELKKLYSDIEKIIYKRDGVSINRNSENRDSLGDRLNYARGKTSYRNISIVTEIPKKRLSKIYAGDIDYFDETKGNKHFKELSTICFVAGIPITDILNSTVIPKKGMNPFEHLDDDTSNKESRRLTLLLHRILYIKGTLTFMYKVNSEFTINIIKWYKKIGLDDMNKLIEFIQSYLKKNHSEQFVLYCGDSFDC